MLEDIFYTHFRTPFLAFFSFPVCQYLRVLLVILLQIHGKHPLKSIAYVAICVVNSGSLGTWRNLENLVKISKHHLPSSKIVGKASFS